MLDWERMAGYDMTTAVTTQFGTHPIVKGDFEQFLTDTSSQIIPISDPPVCASSSFGHDVQPRAG